jgi:hypothetical protein
MRLVPVLLLCSSWLLAGSPKLGPKVKLFNGKNLEGFYTYLEKHGNNNDPDHVFRVENGAVHVSGSEFGYFITDKEYENYYLHVLFRWGEHTYEPRKDKARDSGVLFHVNGEDKIWPHSIEFQMIEGGTGDIILVGDTRLTVKGETKEKGRFDRFGRGPFKDVAGYRDPQAEVEKPHGPVELPGIVGGWRHHSLLREPQAGERGHRVIVDERAHFVSVRRSGSVLQSDGAAAGAKCCGQINYSQDTSTIPSQHLDNIDAAVR